MILNSPSIRVDEQHLPPRCFHGYSTTAAEVVDDVSPVCRDPAGIALWMRQIQRIHRYWSLLAPLAVKVIIKTNSVFILF